VDSLEDPLGKGKYKPSFFNRSLFLPEKLSAYLSQDLKRKTGVPPFFDIAIFIKGSEFV
jgi:hypothetical protein